MDFFFVAMEWSSKFGDEFVGGAGVLSEIREDPYYASAVEDGNKVRQIFASACVDSAWT